MPVKFEIKAVQVGNSLKITVPKELAKHLELKKGDTVLMWADNSHVILERVSTAPSQEGVDVEKLQLKKDLEDAKKAKADSDDKLKRIKETFTKSKDLLKDESTL